MSIAAMSFAAIAVELKLAANEQALSIEHTEQLVARMPECAGFNYALVNMRLRADALALAHAHFKSLAEAEDAKVTPLLRQQQQVEVRV